MIRGWLVAAAAVLCLAAAGPGAPPARSASRATASIATARPGSPRASPWSGWSRPAGGVANKPTYAAARAAFGPGMLGEVRRFGADLVRFQISQFGLDPKSKGYDPDYRDEVLAAVAETRDAGFNVIVSMQWQGVSGRRGEGLPTGATRRAWASIVPEFGDDRGVLLEIFNEPEINPRTPAEWGSWRKSMQGLVDALRRAGSENVLLGRRLAVRP